MAWSHRATVCLVLLGLGLGLAIFVLAVTLSHHCASCGPGAFAHAAFAADSKICSDIGRAILQQQGSPTDAAIAALICTGVVNPQSMGLGGGVIFTIYSATTGKVEVINARETVPASHVQGLLDQCKKAQPLGTGAQWIGVPGELRGYAEAHRRHGRLPWAQLFQPTIALLREGFRVPSVLSQYLSHNFLRPFLYSSSLSLLTVQDLAAFQPEVVAPLEMALGNYTLYSPPPPAGGAILNFILNVLQGFNFSAETVARPEGKANMYHHLVETLKFAIGQRWLLWDSYSRPGIQNTSQNLLGEALAQHIRQKIDGRGDHQLSHYNLIGVRGNRMGTSHVSVLGEDGSAVAATSTINTPFGAMVYSPRTGILLNNELLDLCWRHEPGSSATPPPGERPPSYMVPSILVNKAQGSKLVIGGAGGELIMSAVVQTIMNKLWLGFDLTEAIAAPILHVNSKGHVEYEPKFNEEVKKGLQDRGQSQSPRLFFLNSVQAVSQEGPCVYAASDQRKAGKASGY
ncbi:Gamma-glutamyltransferase 5 [Microtus ochrogaster]|uniref:Glutathione hydrolase 5 proenzyme n=1 Tax=Microtus ochrogaster TaxID=79684 RepID=A0A8J6GW99_MICOH|nr:Gamma-glutamyltransferase 5 [Microtus ochrogaster]